MTLVVLVPSMTEAIDHKNLDEGRPLRIEDAYAIAEGEWEIELGSGVADHRDSRTRALFSTDFVYGLWKNLQVSVGTTVSTDPRKIEDPSKSGDLKVSALYNFNEETLVLPAFGIRVTGNFPTGTNSSGVDVRLKGLVSRSYERLTLHFNPAYEVFSGTAPNQRDGRFDVAVGASYQLGAPSHTRTTMLADFFSRQSILQGQSSIEGMEFGVRYQWTPWTVLNAALGSEFSGPAERTPFFLVIGLSVAF
jgi:hypothetical protein